MNEKKKMQRCPLLPLAISLGVVGLWLIGVWLVHVAGHGQGVFEGLSALFSGLAFIGVIFALTYQRQELLLQREELRKSREEAHATAMANQESARIALDKIKLETLEKLMVSHLEQAKFFEGHPETQQKLADQYSRLDEEKRKILKDLIPDLF